MLDQTNALRLATTKLRVSQPAFISHIMPSLVGNLVSKIQPKLKFAYLGNTILHGIAKPYTKEELSSSETKNIVNLMKKEMATHGGVGLAAPQVQLGKQLFVMQVEQNKLTPKLQPVPFTALFNPSWTPIGKSTYKSYESCLSVPGLWGMVERYEKIKVEYTNMDGVKKQFVADGLISAIVQHEYDHLQGKVYLDKVKDKSTLIHDSEFALRYDPSTEWGTYTEVN